MNAIVHQFSQRGIDGALALDTVEAGEGGAFDDQGEMAFAAAVMAGVADMTVALVFELEPGRSKRGDEALFYLGRNWAGGGGEGVHHFYIGR